MEHKNKVEYNVTFLIIINIIFSFCFITFGNKLVGTFFIKILISQHCCRIQHLSTFPLKLRFSGFDFNDVAEVRLVGQPLQQYAHLRAQSAGPMQQRPRSPAQPNPSATKQAKGKKGRRASSRTDSSSNSSPRTSVESGESGSKLIAILNLKLATLFFCQSWLMQTPLSVYFHLRMQSHKRSTTS